MNIDNRGDWKSTGVLKISKNLGYIRQSNNSKINERRSRNNNVLGGKISKKLINAIIQNLRVIKIKWTLLKHHWKKIKISISSENEPKNLLEL